MKTNFEFARDIIWFAEQTFQNIDFKLLRAQRHELVGLLERPIHNHLTEAQIDSIKHSIDLIDEIRGNATDFELATEDEVYGPHCPACSEYVEPEDYDFNKQMCKKCAQEKNHEIHR